MCVRSLAVQWWLEIAKAPLVGSENTNEMSLRSGTVWMMRGGWQVLHSTYTAWPPPGQCPKGICWTDMVVRVIVSDTRGGWTWPRANSLQPLLLLSSPTEERERERERESLVYTFFPLYSTPQCEQQNSKVSGGSCDFFSFHICTCCIGNYCEYIMFFFSVQSRPEWEQA